MKEEYTYFTQDAFEACFAALGLRVLASVPLWNPWIVRERFESHRIMALPLEGHGAQAEYDAAVNLKRADADRAGPLAQALTAVAAELGTDIARIASEPESAAVRLAPLKEPLTQLCATYLLHRADAGESAQDPVARFHLNNGAKLERINWLADISRNGLRQSLGLMVNYLYEPKAIEENHEKFARGEIVASSQVRALALGD